MVTVLSCLFIFLEINPIFLFIRSLKLNGTYVQAQGLPWPTIIYPGTKILRPTRTSKILCMTIVENLYAVTPS